MWCESKNPHVKRACKIFASEEVKHDSVTVRLSQDIGLVEKPSKEGIQLDGEENEQLETW